MKKIFSIALMCAALFASCERPEGPEPDGQGNGEKYSIELPASDVNVAQTLASFMLTDEMTITKGGEIVDELNHRGIITDTELWTKKLREDNNSMALAKKCANQTVNCTGKKELTSVNDIVWELSSRGIITEKDLWLEKLESDANSYWLARKCANYIRRNTR